MSDPIRNVEAEGHREKGSRFLFNIFPTTTIVDPSFSGHTSRPSTLLSHRGTAAVVTGGVESSWRCADVVRLV